MTSNLEGALPVDTPPDEGAADQRLVVAALTYNRPHSLRRLLAAWSHIDAPEDAIFLIVDNSPDANARILVATEAARRSIDIRYVHEPEPGISAARNCALASAIGFGGALLAFIDDDELPTRSWLVGLLETRRLTGAEGVIGRVDAQLPPEAPDWISRAGYFDIAGAADGHEISDGATCNALIDLDFVRRHGLRFDPEFGLSGAEDTLFFRAMRALGGRIVYSEAAVVHDIIPAKRAQLRWLKKRWRRTGNTDARIKMLEGRSRAHIAASGAARFALGGAIALGGLAPALAGRFDTVAKGIRVLERGVGYVAAARGRRLIEYRVKESRAGGRRVRAKS